MSEYPRKTELRRIAEWDINSDLDGLLEFIEELWHGEDGFKLSRDYVRGYHHNHVRQLELYTGGWSGNEDIIAALEANRMFFTLYWKKSERGGYYHFELSEVIDG